MALLPNGWNVNSNNLEKYLLKQKLLKKRGRKPTVNPKEIMAMVQGGAKHKEIQKALSTPERPVSLSNINKIIQNFNYDKAKVKEFRENKAEIVEDLQMKAVLELSNNRINRDISDKTLVDVMGETNKIIKLERGLPTEINMDVLITQENQENLKLSTLDSNINILLEKIHKIELNYG